MLQEAGVPVRTDVYPGIPHGGPDFLPMHSVAKKSLVDFKAALEWIVSQQK
jgi:acetyl esterase/lipase